MDLKSIILIFIIIFLIAVFCRDFLYTLKIKTTQKKSASEVAKENFPRGTFFEIRYTNRSSIQVLPFDRKLPYNFIEIDILKRKVFLQRLTPEDQDSKFNEKVVKIDTYLITKKDTIAFDTTQTFFLEKRPYSIKEIECICEKPTHVFNAEA